jgi:hypothetical protein
LEKSLTAFSRLCHGQVPCVGAKDSKGVKIPDTNGTSTLPIRA